MKDFLLEIGCENLPPHGIRSAFESLHKLAEASLASLRFEYKSIYTTGAPRRLVLIVEGLADKQTAGKETVTGPPIDRAFDDAGKPTKAAEGFARSRGVSVDKLQTVETPKGKFLGITQKLPTQSASKILQQEIPQWVRSLTFPKLMHWESEGLVFARPIRWLLCLHGDKVVPLKLAGVKSDALTYTVPWVRPKGLRVRNAKHYRDVMKKQGVIVDHERRRRTIETLAANAADRAGLKLIEDGALVNELTFMLEEPKPLMGEFDKRYLTLPAEVVTTAMRSHQRYMAFRKGRKLVAKFLTFTEGKVGSPATVRKGNEKVLRARLEDALFYWHDDLKTGMDGLAGKLDAIVFIEGLGTLGDKSRRIAALVGGVQEALQVEAPVDDQVLKRAATVAKADLASEMIKDGKEFTLLQGLIGAYYAKECGEAAEVVDAIREQYLPRNPGDKLPKTVAGRCLGIADRIDTITGCFLAGFRPTGSQDPYALRRQANAVIRLIEEASDFSLLPLIEASVAPFTSGEYKTEVGIDAVSGELVDFFKQRVATYLKERGVAYDAVDAVTAVAWERPGAALEQARAIERMRGDDAFELLITGVKRVGNILSSENKRFGHPMAEVEAALAGASRAFDPKAFTDAAEGSLHSAVVEALPELVKTTNAGDIDAALRRLAKLGPVIDAYFDAVLVNADDAAVRANRHAFLAAIFGLFSQYADFSHIVESGQVAVG